MFQKTALLVAFFGVSLVRGCADEGPRPAPQTTTAEASRPLALAPAAPPSRHAKESCEEAPPPTIASERFSAGERAFASTRRALLEAYYDDGLTDDDLYRAAVAGMLERVDPSMHKWNKLLSPRDLAEVRSDLHGEIVGVGVQIDFSVETGRATVLAVIPGSPAERAAIHAGDEIIAVDGKLYKGKTAMDMATDIRGAPFAKVTLTMLRGDKLEALALERQPVALDPVVHSALGDGVGYVRIRGFSDKTTPLVGAALDALAQTGTRSLVLDLRGNPGGAFDAAIASAGLFLPAGAPVTLLERRGHKVETIAAKGGAKLAGIPIAVLVDRWTASGGELVAAALAEGRGAQLVGRPTLGKWSVQTIDELSNGYAIKYTTSLFASPSGKRPSGTGLVPDVDVELDEKEVERACAIAEPEKRLAADVQLRAAVALLRARR